MDRKRTPEDCEREALEAEQVVSTPLNPVAAPFLRLTSIRLIC